MVLKYTGGQETLEEIGSWEYKNKTARVSGSTGVLEAQEGRSAKVSGKHRVQVTVHRKTQEIHNKLYKDSQEQDTISGDTYFAHLHVTQMPSYMCASSFGKQPRYGSCSISKEATSCALEHRPISRAVSS